MQHLSSFPRIRRFTVELAGVSLILMIMMPLAACGGGSSSNGQTLHVLIGTYSNPVKERQWMQQIGSEFKKATGATIAWDTYSSSSEEQTKVAPVAFLNSLPNC